MKTWHKALATAFIAFLLSAGSVEARHCRGCPRRQIASLGTVTVTVYHAVPDECDDTPHLTASGVNLNDLPEDTRVAAVSQDLLWFKGGPIRWGDTIYVLTGDGRVDGRWTVQDTMAETYVRKGIVTPVRQWVDLLVNNDVIDRWENAKAYHFKRKGGIT